MRTMPFSFISKQITEHKEYYLQRQKLLLILVCLACLFYNNVASNYIKDHSGSQDPNKDGQCKENRPYKIITIVP